MTSMCATARRTACWTRCSTALSRLPPALRAGSDANGVQSNLGHDRPQRAALADAFSVALPYRGGGAGSDVGLGAVFPVVWLGRKAIGHSWPTAGMRSPRYLRIAGMLTRSMTRTRWRQGGCPKWGGFLPDVADFDADFSGFSPGRDSVPRAERKGMS